MAKRVAEWGQVDLRVWLTKNKKLTSADSLILYVDQKSMDGQSILNLTENDYADFAVIDNADLAKILSKLRKEDAEIEKKLKEKREKEERQREKEERQREKEERKREKGRKNKTTDDKDSGIFEWEKDGKRSIIDSDSPSSANTSGTASFGVSLSGGSVHNHSHHIPSVVYDSEELPHGRDVVEEATYQAPEEVHRHTSTGSRSPLSPTVYEEDGVYGEDPLTSPVFSRPPPPPPPPTRRISTPTSNPPPPPNLLKSRQLSSPLLFTRLVPPPPPNPRTVRTDLLIDISPSQDFDEAFLSPPPLDTMAHLPLPPLDTMAHLPPPPPEMRLSAGSPLSTSTSSLYMVCDEMSEDYVLPSELSFHGTVLSEEGELPPPFPAPQPGSFLPCPLTPTPGYGSDPTDLYENGLIQGEDDWGEPPSDTYENFSDNMPMMPPPPAGQQEEEESEEESEEPEGFYMNQPEVESSEGKVDLKALSRRLTAAYKNFQSESDPIMPARPGMLPPAEPLPTTRRPLDPPITSPVTSPPKPCPPPKPSGVIVRPVTTPEVIPVKTTSIQDRISMFGKPSQPNLDQDKLPGSVSVKDTKAKLGNLFGGAGPGLAMARPTAASPPPPKPQRNTPPPPPLSSIPINTYEDVVILPPRANSTSRPPLPVPPPASDPPAPGEPDNLYQLEEDPEDLYQLEEDPEDLYNDGDEGPVIPGYVPVLTRDEAVAYLRQDPQSDCFLVRDSTSNPEVFPYVISIKAGGTGFEHTRLGYRPDRRLAIGSAKPGETTHASLTDLIRYHGTTPLLLRGRTVVLRNPVHVKR